MTNHTTKKQKEIFTDEIKSNKWGILAFLKNSSKSGLLYQDDGELIIRSSKEEMQWYIDKCEKRIRENIKNNISMRDFCLDKVNYKIELYSHSFPIPVK